MWSWGRRESCISSPYMCSEVTISLSSSASPASVSIIARTNDHKLGLSKHAWSQSYRSQGCTALLASLFSAFELILQETPKILQLRLQVPVAFLLSATGHLSLVGFPYPFSLSPFPFSPAMAPRSFLPLQFSNGAWVLPSPSVQQWCQGPFFPFSLALAPGSFPLIPLLFLSSGSCE